MMIAKFFMNKYVWAVIVYFLLLGVAYNTWIHTDGLAALHLPLPGFPGIFDAACLAVDSGPLFFLVLSWLLYRRYHKPFLLVLTTVFAYTLVLTGALTVWLWTFRGY